MMPPFLYWEEIAVIVSFSRIVHRHVHVFAGLMRSAENTNRKNDFSFTKTRILHVAYARRKHIQYHNLAVPESLALSS